MDRLREARDREGLSLKPQQPKLEARNPKLETSTKKKDIRSNASQ